MIRGPGVRVLPLAASVVGALAAPAALAGQTCVGTPVGGGQIALGGGVRHAGERTGYLAEVRFNDDGPWAVAGSFSVDTFDDTDADGRSGRARLLRDLTWLGRTFCPFVGVRYSAVDAQDDLGVTTVTLSRTTLVLGTGLGTRHTLESGLELVGGVAPQVLLLRSVRLVDDVLQGNRSQIEYSTRLAGSAAGGVAFGPVFLASELAVRDIPGAELELEVVLGLRR